MSNNLQVFVARDRVRWPLLNLAAKDTRMAESTKIEWLVCTYRPCECGRDEVLERRDAKHNRTQIFRGKTREEVCDEIEHSLAHDQFQRGRDYYFMDGVRSILGRHERITDEIALYVLQDLRRIDLGADVPVEFLAEVSVLARAGA